MAGMKKRKKKGLLHPYVPVVAANMSLSTGCSLNCCMVNRPLLCFIFGGDVCHFLVAGREKEEEEGRKT